MTGAEIAETALLVLGGLVFEAWLGVTPRFKAGSTLQLAYNALSGLVKLARSATARARLKPEGATRMSIENKTVAISAPTFKAIKAVEELIADLIEGRKNELGEDGAAIFQAFMSSGEIVADFKTNPEAVETAALLAGPALIKRLLASLKSKGAAPAGE